MSTELKYSSLSLKNKLGRSIWIVVRFLLFRPFPTRIFNFWRLFLLRIFGARVHPMAHVYASAIVWAPWNLEMAQNSCLGPDVDCYNPAPVLIGKDATVSQKSYLCTASHDINNRQNPLITAPIIIEELAWVAADAFIGPGVRIGKGAVVGARASVFKDVEPWTVVGGNPAKFISKRNLND